MGSYPKDSTWACDMGLNPKALTEGCSTLLCALPQSTQCITKSSHGENAILGVLGGMSSLPHLSHRIGHSVCRASRRVRDDLWRCAEPRSRVGFICSFGSQQAQWQWMELQSGPEIVQSGGMLCAWVQGHGHCGRSGLHHYQGGPHKGACRSHMPAWIPSDWLWGTESRSGVE